MSDEDRRRLAILLRSATHHCEERLRERLRPRLTDALEAVGFKPVNYPEEVARRKMVKEMLDRVTERGFLTMGDLRSAVARNQLKLPDLDGPKTLLMGDQLIRLNRRLAIDLDGVYKRGEFYLRWLQRLSSLFFGTYLGRLLTLFVALPFGGAFATLVFAQEMLHLAHLPHHLSPTGTWTTVGVLGVFYLLLIHWPRLPLGGGPASQVRLEGLARRLLRPTGGCRASSVRAPRDGEPTGCPVPPLRPAASCCCWFGGAALLAVGGERNRHSVGECGGVLAGAAVLRLAVGAARRGGGHRLDGATGTGCASACCRGCST